MNGLIPKLAVLGAVAVALLVPASQAAFGWGQTASEFSESGDETLRAAGWAFSIWGLIYVGLAAFAVYQLGNRSGALRRVRWPAAAAALGCGLWIAAAAVDSRWLTVLIISASAVAAVAAAWTARGSAKAGELAFRLLALWPLSLLAGWLTIATLVNLLTVLTAEGLVTGSARGWAALAGVATATVIAAAVTLRARMSLYAAPVVWGLVAVTAAARQDAQPVLAAVALGAGLLLALVAATPPLRRRAIEREP
jgi:hypothetical protein